MTPSTEGCVRPCMIVAHPDAVYRAATSRAFRRLGWDVYPARGGAEARRLTRLLGADLLLLAAEFPDETGWLVCDKLRRETPGTRVFIVADAVAGVHAEFARFVGAAGVIDRHASADKVQMQIRGQALPVAS